jgi:hypothetical protein
MKRLCPLCCAWTTLVLIVLSPVAAQTTGTALVRRAPTLNSGTIEGSLHQLTPESVTLNGGVVLTGDLLVPGTPTIRLNGQPLYTGTIEGSGSSSPTNYQVTLNGAARVRHIVRRSDPVLLETVTAPMAPSGTRSVAINASGQSAGDFGTLRNLTLNGGAGTLAVPAGTYGEFTANANTRFVLGEPGATQPAVYHFQRLILNGSSAVQVLGPVIVTVQHAIALNGVMGHAGDPGRLVLRLASGGLTLNGGSAFYGYVSAPDGSVTINGNAQFTGGLVADRLTLNGGASLRLIPPANQNAAPTVTIVSPADGASYTAPAAFTVQMTAADSDGLVASVELFAGANKIGTDTVAPFEIPVSGLAVGVHDLIARATDNRGATTDSARVKVVITHPNQPPVVSLSAPQDGALLLAPATIGVAATAADPDGAIARVEFYIGDSRRAEDTSAPYEWNATGLAAGTYRLTARAFDQLGAVGVSSPVTVTVVNPNLPPAVALAGPQSGATFSEPATFQLLANASDSDGSITRVVFLRDGAILGEDNAAPFEWNVTALAAGTYYFVARAHDDRGGATDSAPVAITVSSPNLPPFVRVLEPLAGAHIAAFTPVTFAALATDSDGTVAAVEFFNGAQRLGAAVPSDVPSRFVYTLSSGLAPGAHSIVAHATDALGSTAVSASVSLTAQPRLPYTADFELTEGYRLGPLGGQLGWQVGSGSATITTEIAYAGTQAVLISPSASLTQVGQTFAPLADERVVFVDWFTRPASEADAGTSTTFDVDAARIGFRREAGGTALLAWAGDGAGGGTWRATGFTAANDAIGVTAAWIRLSVRLDFATGRWDLYANGIMVAGALGFRDAARTAFGTFSVRGATFGSTWLDYLFAASTNPLFIDADKDGLEDTWERSHGMDPLANDRATDLDGDGLSNLDEYIAGSAPSDYFNGALPELISLVAADQRPAADGSIAVRVVKASGSPAANAPVEFRVVTGDLGLAPSSTGANHVVVAVRTDAAGVARVFVRFPAAPSPTTVVSATCRSGTAERTLSLTVTPPIVDVDGDALDDAWEVRFLGALDYGATDDPGAVGRPLLTSFREQLSPWPAPPVVGGLRAWYRADLGLATNAVAGVMRWTDLSGRGIHLAGDALGALPIKQVRAFGVRPAVRWDGTARALASAPVDILGGSQDATIIVVLAPAASQGADATVVAHTREDGARGFDLAQFTGVARRYYLGWRAAPTGAVEGAAGVVDLPPDQRSTLMFMKAGSSQSGSVNGAVASAITVAPLWLQGAGILSLGGAREVGRAFRGDVAEVLIYDRALSPAERQLAETALRQQYDDSDADGLLDVWELQHFGALGVLPGDDADGDGLTNQREFELGTDPKRADTDGDRIADGWEVLHGLDPSVPDGGLDPDGDGLSNQTEFLLGTNPNRAALPDLEGRTGLRVFRPQQ